MFTSLNMMDSTKDLRLRPRYPTISYGNDMKWYTQKRGHGRLCRYPQ